MLGDLIADPLGVGRRWAIQAGYVTDLDVKQVGTYRPLGAGPIALYETSSAPWLVKDCTAKYGAAMIRLHQSREVGVSEKTGCFYLPWASHCVYRMSLKDVGPYRVFFTAPLTGCAVVVEGTPERPVVYHANANGLDEEESPMADPTCVEVRALGFIEKRNAAMFAACRAFPGDLDSFSDAMNSGATTALEYGVLIGRPSEAAEKNALRKNLELPGWLRDTGWEKAPTDLKFHKSFGTVFGVRGDKGRWAFYQQKVMELKEGTFVLSCQEFWPSGFRRNTF